MDCVQARYVADGYPIVHGWVFNLRNGRLIDLDIDFAHLMDDIQKIYDITDSHWVVNQRKVG
jgi:carbonate dehydratase